MTVNIFENDPRFNPCGRGFLRLTVRMGQVFGVQFFTDQQQAENVTEEQPGRDVDIYIVPVTAAYRATANDQR